MAEQYFKHYPTIDFDLKNDGNLIEAKDIFRNIRVSEDVEEGITGYEYYYVDDQDRPDVLADKLYADSTLYWLFWMVNPHLATYTDWPQVSESTRKIHKKKVFW
jgi:hypothetical protein